MSTQQDIVIKIALDGWFAYIKRTDALVSQLTDEQLLHETSPGKNTGTYLLGHLTAVHSRMLPLLNFGEQLYPALDDVFVFNPDKSGKTQPSLAELRQYWKEVNSKLEQHFNALTTDEWFERHTSVSGEDFAKEPHRNKLGVLLSRTTHLSYHYGQMVYLK